MFLDELKDLKVQKNMKEICDETPLSDEEENTIMDNSMSVMRCIFSFRDDDNQRRMDIFSMYILCTKIRCKVVIYEGSIINIISIQSITKMNLITEPHLELFHVRWVNHTFKMMASYIDQIWCDILLMKSHIYC